MPQFDPQTFSPQLAWLLLTMGIMLAVMAGYIAPKLFGFITGRQKKMSDMAEQTERMGEELTALKAEYDARLQSAKDEAQKEIRNLLQSIADDYALQRRKMQEERKDSLQKLEQELTGRNKEFESAIRDDLAEMASMVQNRLTDTPVGS